MSWVSGVIARFFSTPWYTLTEFKCKYRHTEAEKEFLQQCYSAGYQRARFLPYFQGIKASYYGKDHEH